MRVGGTYNLGEILKSSNGEVSHKVLGPFFMGRVIPQNTKSRFSFGKWRRAVLDEMVKKWGTERFSTSYTCSCTISFLMKILLAKLKDLYIQYA